MIFQLYSDQVREDSNDDNKPGSTAQEFVDLVHFYIDSRPCDLWKYWGKLMVRNRGAREIRRMFAIWCSMLERKAGQPKFRVVTGAEILGARSADFYRVCSVDFHVFIGEISPEPHFEEYWEAQWLKLGGDTAGLQKFDWPGVEAYLKSFSPDRRFEIEVKWRRRARIVSSAYRNVLGGRFQRG
jgi:hypothetical protein